MQFLFPDEKLDLLDSEEQLHPFSGSAKSEENKASSNNCMWFLIYSNCLETITSSSGDFTVTNTLRFVL